MKLNVALVASAIAVGTLVQAAPTAAVNRAMLLARNSADDAPKTADALRPMTQGNTDVGRRTNLIARDTIVSEDAAPEQEADLKRRTKESAVFDALFKEDVVPHLNSLSVSELARVVKSHDPEYPKRIEFVHGNYRYMAKEEVHGDFPSELWEKLQAALGR